MWYKSKLIKTLKRVNKSLFVDKPNMMICVHLKKSVEKIWVRLDLDFKMIIDIL